MQIVIDLDTRKPQRSLTDSRTATQFDFKRGDDAIVEILFVRGGVQTQLTAGIAITFGVKLRGRYDSLPLVQSNDFTLSGSGATAKYIGYPSFNTEELNEALGIDDDESNDIAVLDLMGEISWTEPTTEILTSSETFAVRVNNDVNREDDAPPNALPSPSDWLDARAVRFDKSQTLTDAQKQSARGNIDAMPEPIILDAEPVVSTMSVSGTLTDGTNVLTPPEMQFVGIAQGKPFFESADQYHSIGWNDEQEQFYLSLNDGGAVWTSTAPVSTPDLVPAGAWHATTNPHGWKPLSPATGTPIISDVGTAAQAVGQLVRVGTAAPYAWHRVQTLSPNTFAPTTPTIAEITGLSAELTAAKDRSNHTGTQAVSTLEDPENLPISEAVQNALDKKLTAYRTDGGTAASFEFHAEQIVIADGPDQYGRAYHAFPDLTIIGDTYWQTYMTSGAHADRRADIVIKSSTDGRNWTERKRFSASRPTGTIVVGDIEYRACNLTDLGGGCIVAVLHKYTVVDTTSSGLLFAAGNSTAWSLSRDNGNTWSDPVQLGDITESYVSIGGMTAAVWKGDFYFAAYGVDPLGGGIYRTPVSALKAGAPVWTSQVVDLGQEPCVQVNPRNPDELWVFGRRNGTFVSWRTTTDGTTWATRKDSYFAANTATNVGMKPLQLLTESGYWVIPKRGENSNLYPEILIGADPMTVYSCDGTPNNEIWPTVAHSSHPVPVAELSQRAWNNYEKAMYSGMALVGGDLVAMNYALEPQEQNDEVNSSAGQRSSVFFTFFGSGEGLTPWGSFTPATRELSGSALSLADPTYNSYRKWMSADAEFVITNGTSTVALEILGDFVPTFSVGGSPITPTGSYDPNKKNVALITPGPSVRIVNVAPPSPMEITGLREKVLCQFSPAGLVLDGSNVNSWTNEGDTSYVASLIAGTTKPTVALAASPNGRNVVQGASAAWFDNAGGNVPISAVFALCTADAGTWTAGFQTVVTNAIQGGAVDTAAWQIGAPWATYHRFKNGVYDNPAAAPATDWAIIECRQRNVNDGSGSNWSELAAANLSVILNQAGFTGTRGWKNKVGSLVILKTPYFPTNRESYLIRRWMRSL